MFLLSYRWLLRGFATSVLMLSSVTYGNDVIELVPVEDLSVTGTQSIPVTPANSALTRSPAEQQFTLELLGLVERLQQEVAQLRGQFEELSYQVGKTDGTQKDRYIDLDKRLSNLSEQVSSLRQGQTVTTVATAKNTTSTLSTATVNSATNLAPEDTQPALADPAQQQTQYKDAFNLIRSKKYAEAVTALQQFIDRYPKGIYTVNAHYWLGEVYLVEEQPELALKSFELVVNDYPQHRKAPDAMYKMARSLMSLGEQAKGDAMLARVIAEHPQSSAAQLARQLQP